MTYLWKIFNLSLKINLLPGLLLWSLVIHSQNTPLDSLKNKLSKASSEPQKIDVLLALSDYLREIDPMPSIEYGLAAHQLTRKPVYDSLHLQTCLLLGYLYGEKYMDYLKATEYVKEALQLSRKIKNKTWEAKAYSTFGDLYKSQRLYAQSLDNYQNALQIYRRRNQKTEQALCLKKIGDTYHAMGKHPQAQQSYFKALKIQEQETDTKSMAHTYHQIGEVYRENKNFQQALHYFQEALTIYKQESDPMGLTASYLKIGLIHCQLMDMKQAQKYLNQVMYMDYSNSGNPYKAEALHNLALIAEKRKNFEQSIHLYKNALEIEKALHNQNMVAESVLGLSRIFLKENMLDSAQNYAEQSFLMYKFLENSYGLENVSYVLYQIFKAKKNYPEALRYHEMYKSYSENMFSEESTRELARIEVKYELEKEQQKTEMQRTKELMAKEQEIQKQKFIRNSVVTAFIFLLILALILYRGYLMKRKDNRLLSEKNEEISRQYQKISEQQEELLKTQDHLIRSEKLASLGQFMAGIAHEINTPMAAIQASGENILTAVAFTLDNFLKVFSDLDDSSKNLFQQLIFEIQLPPRVRNYFSERAQKKEYISELNRLGISNSEALPDLLVELNLQKELKDYLPLLRHPDALLIFQNLYYLKSKWQNSQNIQTATAKVSRILQALKAYTHTEINEKARFYDLRENIDGVLTLYPLSAQVQLVKKYEDIPEIECFPDELTQVWTNLIKNAVQAMKGKGILEINLTEKEHTVEVHIKDNGEGIPDELREKVFEPFFTTKARGEGSGLGLDISKKIVEKHQGHISFESQPGQGTTFIVALPKKKY
ncbi:MAG: tetratricopeptide repeat protein [Microscillaceae bacterium]|nr:tetratricopeptide repeat protein [Microscillaceae bacterium]